MATQTSCQVTSAEFRRVYVLVNTWQPSRVSGLLPHTAHWASRKLSFVYSAP